MMKTKILFLAWCCAVTAFAQAPLFGPAIASRELRSALLETNKANFLTALGAAGTNMAAATIGTLTSTNFNVQEVIAQVFTVAGTPRDIRADGAVAGESIITTNVAPTPIDLYTGSARKAIEAAIAAGHSNIFIPAGRWNMYQGRDTSAGRSQGILVDRDLVIQGVPGATTLDFGRVADQLQAEFIHIKGRLVFKDVSCVNFNYLVNERYDTRRIDSHTTVIIDGGDHVGSALVAPMATPYGPHGGASDIYRTNLFTSATWTPGAGWTESGGHYTYAQPAALAVTNVARTSAGLVTILTDGAHGLSAGDWFTISDCSDATFNSAVTRVSSVVDEVTLRFHQASLVAVTAKAVTGNLHKLGKLSIAHDVDLRPGDYIRTRLRLGPVTSTNGSGVYLYVGGTPGNKRVHGSPMNVLSVSRTGSGTPRYTQINVPGHDFRRGDILDLNDTGQGFYDTNTFTVVGLSSTSSAFVMCTPEPGTTMTVNAGSVRFAQREATHFAKSATTATLTLTVPGHGYLPGALVTLRTPTVAASIYTNQVMVVQTVPTADTFTVTWNPGTTVGTTALDPGSYVENCRGEEQEMAFGIDDAIYLIPEHTFAGTVGHSEIWLANWHETYLRNLSFHTPSEFCADGRDGVQLWSGQLRTVIENCFFSGGSRKLYLGKPDSETVTFNAGDYNRETIIDRCRFNGIGLSEIAEGRALNFHGKNLALLNSKFNRVGYGAVGRTLKGTRTPVWFAAEHALIDNCSFVLSEDGSRIIYSKVGGQGPQYGWYDKSDGNPRNWSTTISRCDFDGTGLSVPNVIAIDGKPDGFRIIDSHFYNFTSLSALVTSTSGAHGSVVEISDNRVRDCVITLAIYDAFTANQQHIKVLRNNLREVNTLSHFVRALGPRYIEVGENWFEKAQANRNLATAFVTLVDDATYEVGQVILRNNMSSIPSGVTYGLSLPSSGMVITNLVMQGNRLGAGTLTIQNESGNTIQTKRVRDNDTGAGVSIVEDVTGMFYRTNATLVPIPVMWMTDSTPPAYAKFGDSWLSNSVRLWVLGTNGTWAPINTP